MVQSIMKGRESGMPDKDYWQSFFDADCIVEKLECAKDGKERIAEFGSGYGTFTLPAARRTSGVVYAFDIDPDLTKMVRKQARREGLSNVQAIERDFPTIPSTGCTSTATTTTSLSYRTCACASTR